MNDTTIEMILKAQDQASGQIKEVESQVSKLATSTEKSGPSFLSMATAVAAGQAALQAFEAVGRTVIGFLTSTVTEAEHEQQVMTQITAAIARYGDQAVISAEGAEKLAESIANTVPVSHDSVLAAEQVALKYDKINKDQFPTVIKLAADMSTYLGTDVPSAMNMLGKSLENPGMALRILKTGGVQVTDEMAKMLKQAQKTGDTLGAQTIIIDALKKKYDGAGSAAATTFAGGMEILNDHVQRLKEGIGLTILNAINPFVQKLTAWASTPEAQKKLEEIAQKVGQMAQQMVDWVQNVATPWITKHWPAIQEALKTTVKVVEWLINAWSNHQVAVSQVVVGLGILLFFINPVQGIILALVGIVMTMVSVWGELRKGFEQAEGPLTRAWQWFSNLNPVILALLGPIGSLVEGIKEVSTHWDSIKSGVSDFFAKGVVKKAEGGVIYASDGFPGGPQGTDTIPAWLTPGERVLSVEDNNKFEHGQLGGGGGITINNENHFHRDSDPVAFTRLLGQQLAGASR